MEIIWRMVIHLKKRGGGGQYQPRDYREPAIGMPSTGIHILPQNPVNPQGFPILSHTHDRVVHIFKDFYQFLYFYQYHLEFLIFIKLISINIAFISL